MDMFLYRLASDYMLWDIQMQLQATLDLTDRLVSPTQVIQKSTI